MDGFLSISCAESFSFHFPDRPEVGPCHISNYLFGFQVHSTGY
jgi:hypothetical protein